MNHCLGDIGSFLQGLGALVIAAGTVYAATVAIREYRHKTRVEKAKWLSDLFRQLFVSRTFKQVRQKIDFDDIDLFRDLAVKELLSQKSGKAQQFSPSERDYLDSFTDYLNFFEFVGLLKETRVLSDEDISSLFDYYIKRLVEIDADSTVRLYLKSLNFEKLSILLNKVTRYLFVYGTLKRGYSRHKLLYDEGFLFLGAAKIRGRLYQPHGVDYPAGVASLGGGYIYGELYLAPKDVPLAWWNDLDSEEGVEDGAFTRVLCTVWCGDQFLNAWTYSYRGDLDNAGEIKLGVWPP